MYMLHQYRIAHVLLVDKRQTTFTDSSVSLIWRNFWKGDMEGQRIYLVKCYGLGEVWYKYAIQSLNAKYPNVSCEQNRNK